VLAAAEPSKLNNLREVAPAALERLPLVLAAAEPSKLNDLREVAAARAIEVVLAADLELRLGRALGVGGPGMADRARNLLSR